MSLVILLNLIHLYSVATSPVAPVDLGFPVWQTAICVRNSNETYEARYWSISRNDEQAYQACVE